MIVGIGLSKTLADKYGKRNVFGLFLFISTLFIIMFNFFKPSSVELIFGAQILHGFFYGITIPLLWAMIADVADYSEWKNKRRATAIIFSAMMVGLKLGLTIGSSLVTKILDYYNLRKNVSTDIADRAPTFFLIDIQPSQLIPLMELKQMGVIKKDNRFYDKNSFMSPITDYYLVPLMICWVYP